MGSIAGLTDETGQVLGLMPHPERNAHLTNHPRWTRLPKDRKPDGLRLFKTAVAGMR
jgi:phosphoribosylformylglycinamidine synthase